jgi:hypothetical protein
MTDNEMLEGIKSLMKERDQAIAERTPHDYGFLKTHIEYLREELHKANLEIRRLAAELKQAKAGATSPGALNDQLLELVSQMNKAQAAQVQPEPSRLELAAMLLAGLPLPQGGSMANQADFALRRADALIAASKASGGSGGCSPQ